MLIITTAPLSDPRLQELFTSAIDGAMAFGYQNARKPPDGHWLTRWWQIGRDMGAAEERSAAHHGAVMEQLGAIERRLGGVTATPVGPGDPCPDLCHCKPGTCRMRDEHEQRKARAHGVAPARPERDHCTDPNNCRRCKAATWEQPNHEHAGIPVGTQRTDGVAPAHPTQENKHG